MIFIIQKHLYGFRSLTIKWLVVNSNISPSKMEGESEDEVFSDITIVSEDITPEVHASLSGSDVTAADYTSMVIT